MSDAVQEAIAAREAAKRPKPVYGRVATVAPPRKPRKPAVEDVPAPQPEIIEEPEPEPIEPDSEGEE